MRRNKKIRKFIVTTDNGKTRLSLGGPHIGIGMEPVIELRDISNLLNSKELLTDTDFNLGDPRIGKKSN